jgi:osmotically-inducible protein OsmY
MMSTKQNPKQQDQTKDGILGDIWDALRKEETSSSLDLGGLSIQVEFAEVYLDGYLKEENQPLVESTIHSVVGVVEVHNRLRTNDGILADIWNALWKEDAIRSLDLNSLSIAVKDGEVYLTGHLAQENNLLRIENIVHSVVGIVSVHNNLVTDHELIIHITQALTRDERTRSFILSVGASHGWINLGGEVPTRELQHVAEKVAGEVAGVRGVIGLPRVTGESPPPQKPAVQPCIGAVVYGRNREEGVVTQVVIQPGDRLVTHVVVRSKELRDIYLVARENIVPVKDIDRVDNESILLVRNGTSFRTYPVFESDEYPLALFTWKAPYPYTAGEVCWSLRQLYEGPDKPPTTGLEPVSSELKVDGTRINTALVSVCKG